MFCFWFFDKDSPDSMTDADKDMSRVLRGDGSEMSFTRDRVNSWTYCAQGMGKVSILQG